MCQKGTGELDGKQLPGTCEFELVILLGIHTRRSRLICHRWATEEDGKGGWIVGYERQNGTDSLKNLLLSRSSYDWKNHRGKVCKIRAPSHPHRALYSLSTVWWHNQTLSLPPPEIKNHRFHRPHCQGPFLQKRGRQIAFNDLIITQEICLFLYLVAVFFSTHLSACFPSLKKSSIPWTAINRFSGCCGEELKISIVPSKCVH